jgi:hypothetical protein
MNYNLKVSIHVTQFEIKKVQLSYMDGYLLILTQMFTKSN